MMRGLCRRMSAPVSMSYPQAKASVPNRRTREYPPFGITCREHSGRFRGLGILGSSYKDTAE
jgi:hypothetical protein